MERTLASVTAYTPPQGIGLQAVRHSEGVVSEVSGTHIPPTTEPMLTIVPLLRDAMWEKTAFAMHRMEKTFVSNIATMRSMGTSASGPDLDGQHV